MGTYCLLYLFSDGLCKGNDVSAQLPPAHRPSRSQVAQLVGKHRQTYRSRDTEIETYMETRKRHADTIRVYRQKSKPFETELF